MGKSSKTGSSSKKSSSSKSKGTKKRSEVIALFGATGRTGSHFLKQALEEGYKVQAQVRSPEKVPPEVGANDRLTLIEGDFSDPENSEHILQATVAGADYVVCMAGGPHHNPKEYKENFMTEFIQHIWPILEEWQPKKFLLQTTALVPKPVDKKRADATAGAANDDGGGDTDTIDKTTLATKLLAKVFRISWSRLARMKPALDDMEHALQYIQDHPLKSEFTRVIVTRPSRLKETVSQKHLKRPLMASLDSAELAPITFEDLASFTLHQFLHDDTLVGQYPFVKLAPLKPPKSRPGLDSSHYRRHSSNSLKGNEK